MFSDSKKPAPPVTYTKPLSSPQAERLRSLLQAKGWEFEPRPYTLYFARQGKVTVAVYEKGPKIVVQGRGLEDFVRFILEPEVLGVAELDYPEASNLETFAPHFGVDESGKGDFFGPLVIAGAYADAAMARQWQAAGVMDSKAIKSADRIRALARRIRETPGAAVNVVLIGPSRYNAMYESFGNLNRLLAWGHARVIENLLELRPDCPRALSDQFAHPVLIQRALMEKGRGIALEQRTKAESDPAVAAASILAREGFLDWMEREGNRLGETLPKGASAAVKKVGHALILKYGSEKLKSLAKMHFKTAAEILSLLD